MVRPCIQLDDELFCLDVVPSWEHRFGIRFAADDFAQATTVGQVWAVVEQRLVARLGEPVSGLTATRATQRTFYQLRQALLTQGVARAAVTPDLPLATVFPWRTRLQRWRQLQQASKLPLPALRPSVVGLVALWAAATAATWGVAPNWGMALLMGFGVALLGSHYGIGRWALPACTLAELTRQLVTIQYQELTHPAMRNNRDEWRDVVLAGLARCDIEAEDLAPDELYDGTAIVW